MYKITKNDNDISHGVKEFVCDTVDDLISTLAGLGITGFVEGGKITLQGDEQAYILEVSENVNNALKLGDVNFDTTDHTTTKNDDSDQQTYTTEMTDKTILKDLNIEEDFFDEVTLKHEDYFIYRLDYKFSLFEPAYNDKEELFKEVLSVFPSLPRLYLEEKLLENLIHFQATFY